jgi:hypothetical protein
MSKRFLLAVLLAGLAACKTVDVGVESLPYNEEIPTGAALVYRIEPSRIEYHYTDSTSGQTMTLRWLSSQGFVGYNCVALSPRTPTDTIGTFSFVARGANQGLLERFQLGAADTILGYFIASSQGSRGTYVRDAQDQLTFFWTNGTPSRYFDPTATIRIAADSLISAVSLSDRADSIAVQWRVVWTENACAP